MKAPEEVTREIKRLEKEVDELKKEVGLYEYCRSHSLKYHDSGDYSRAVSGLLKERRGAGNAAPVSQDGDKVEVKLLMRKHHCGPGISCYNRNDAISRISSILEDLENVSRYGWFDDMGDKINKEWKKVNEQAKDVIPIIKDVIWKKGLGGRRNVRNNTDTTICVTGNTKDNKPELVYLRGRGANSSTDLYDADGVVILEGQRFYADERAMRNKGKTYDSGVIKVGDVTFGWGNAEVRNAPGEKNTFYVNASGTSYQTRDWAEKHGWKLP